MTGSNEKIRLWALDSTLLKELDFGRSGFVRFVTFSPDGKMILAAQSDSIKLWDLDGNVIGRFKINGNRLNAVAFSADGQRVTTCADYLESTISARLPLQDFLNSNHIEPLSPEQKKQYGITDITDPKPHQQKTPVKNQIKN